MLQPCIYRLGLIHFNDVTKKNFRFLLCLLIFPMVVINVSFRFFMYLQRLIVCVISNVSGHSNLNILISKIARIQNFLSLLESGSVYFNFVPLGENWEEISRIKQER